MPKVSVAIASFQHAPYVRQCIESVLDQSFQDFEIVITDDASSDGTADVISSIKDHRIKLEVFGKNQGASAAMNAVIARATGEYVAVLNSDDYWLPHKLEQQVNHLDERPDLAAVFALPKIINELGDELPDHPCNSFFEARTAPRHSWLRQFFFSGNPLCHPTLLIRHKCYTELGGYDCRLLQMPDFDMWVRLASRYDFDVLDERLTAFRILSNNANASAPTPDVQVRTLWEYERVLHKFVHLSEIDVRVAFAEDIATHNLEEVSKLVTLGRLAMSASLPCHHAFGLSVLYDAVGAGLSAIDSKELSEFVASTDPYGMRARLELANLAAKLRVHEA
jgi:glycosyltransferase involved in cell wall biosynthesis